MAASPNEPGVTLEECPPAKTVITGASQRLVAVTRTLCDDV